MFEWVDVQDDSRQVISPRGLLRDRGFDDGTEVAKNVIMFHTGFAIPYILEHHSVSQYPFKVPGFLSNPPLFGPVGRDDICLVQGGYGAPAAACLAEVLIEMGCRRLFVFSLGGGVSDKVKLGDMVLPVEVLREEGTSFHYVPEGAYARPDPNLLEKLRGFLGGVDDLEVYEGRTVSTDAPFRQTVKKELRWRREGILAVEMEMSAVFTVAEFHGIQAVGFVTISDEHDLEGNTPWRWDKEGMREGRSRAVDLLMDFAGRLSDGTG